MSIRKVSGLEYPQLEYIYTAVEQIEHGRAWSYLKWNLYKHKGDGTCSRCT